MNTLLLSSEFSSYHLIQIRTREKSHVHETHDLAVFVQSGFGKMYLGRESFGVRPGSVVFIPRRTPHYFVNVGKTPAVAIAIYSPPFDGKDMVFKEASEMFSNESER